MPAFLAHYLCGVTALETLAGGELKKAALEHPGVYHIGLAGPDLFFYSPSELMRPGMATGRMMHKYRTGAFLQNLFSQVMQADARERSTALAYFAGFLGHYSLDVSTHALVYRICHDPSEKKALGRHFRYEAGMDVMCCSRLQGRDINDMKQVRLIRITGEERRIMARMLHEGLQSIYPDADRQYSARRLRSLLVEYDLITRFLIDRSGFKEWLALGLEKALRGYPLFSPLFINRNRYGLTRHDDERFLRFFQKGVDMNRELLLALQDALTGGPDSFRDFFKTVGSKSYHGFGHREAEIMEKQW